MYAFARHIKNRVAITVIWLLILAALIINNDDLLLLRSGVLNALSSISVIFAVITALTLVLYNNHVSGLKDSYKNKVWDIRNYIENLHDHLLNSKNHSEIEINRQLIVPLLELSTDDWLAFDIPNKIRKECIKPLEEVHKDNPFFLIRYMQRLEDEINELGLMFIRRVVIKNYLDVLKEILTLISSMVVSIILVNILGTSDVFNTLSILIGGVMLFWILIGILYVGSFLIRNGQGEGDQLHNDYETSQ